MLQLLIATVLLTGAQEQEPVVGTGPEPSPTPISWELEFRYLHPRRIEVQLAGADKPAVFWYMVYTAVNTSSTTQRFYPTFELVTDDLRVIETDMGISPIVFDAIRERHKLTHPYLTHPTKAIGDLRVGEDYALESVAIWRADDLKAEKFTIYVAGLSGEARVLRNPAYDRDQPENTTIVTPDGREREVRVNPKYFTLRKTLELRYALPASEQARPQIEPQFAGARWIMR
jgi:hypothetical protein